ncbi:uncharacterized protein LOC120174857 [Hibiscus syriacus]|uniref:uncharacterized protein LOC120174857 n=1 Tax=Hibiscus syriacus TaxID=106335 RepID=UPI0019234AFE|nr:uncharacterized protein LOC120174857 [Hibiscus syriacus]
MLYVGLVFATKADKIVGSLGYENSFHGRFGFSGITPPKLKSSISPINVFMEKFIEKNATRWSFFTTVYASPNITIKKQLWDQLSSFNPGKMKPGSLVEILTAFSRMMIYIGGSEQNRGSNSLFNNFNFDNCLLELNYVGQKFTWRRGNLWQRMDQAFINEEWSNRLLDTREIHMDRIGSDHSPLLIQSTKESGLRKTFSDAGSLTRPPKI